MLYILRSRIALFLFRLAQKLAPKAPLIEKNRALNFVMPGSAFLMTLPGPVLASLRESLSDDEIRQALRYSRARPAQVVINEATINKDQNPQKGLWDAWIHHNSRPAAPPGSFS